MSNPKNAVGRSLVKKRFPNQRRARSGDEWVGNTIVIDVSYRLSISCSSIKNLISPVLPTGIDLIYDPSLIKIP